MKKKDEPKDKKMRQKINTLSSFFNAWKIKIYEKKMKK